MKSQTKLDHENQLFTISQDIFRQISENIQVGISIVDNGSGILDEHKNHVFERSFKHGKTAGTCLGLYIVKKNIERYGGEITIKDNFPKGTIFEIKLKN